MQMRYFCVICFLAFELCFVVCVSVSAAEEEGSSITEAVAAKAVDDAKRSTKNACDKAKSSIHSAKTQLIRVEAFKTKAEEAKFQAEETANDNEEVQTTVENVKTIYDKVSRLYQESTEKLKNAINSLEQVLSEAETLEDKSNKITLSNENSVNNYKEANQEAVDIKTKADELDTNNITVVLQSINGIDSTEGDMEKSANDAQLANFRVTAIVAVAKIDTMMGKVDSIIEQTQNKKNEVNVIVQKMQELKKQIPSSLMKSFDELINSANDELSKAKSAVDNAMSDKTAIEDQKNTAIAALAKVKTETDVTEAQKEADKTNTCVTAIGNIIPQLQSALETASRSVTSANNLQQKMVKTLQTTTTEQNTQQSKEKEETNPPVVDGTESNQKDATTQQTMKDSLNQGDNSAEKLKHSLMKGAQNVPTTALTGVKAPAPGANNDTAMTVSVPLLVALIALAVLQ